MGPLKSILINTDPVLTLWHPLNVATPDTKAISETHTSAIEFALNTTNYPLPLRKLDLVLLPGLRDYSTSKPGVIYYRLSGEHDRSLAQGDREWCQRIGREVSAQWIGQLVSPRDPRDSWFYCGLSDYLALMWLERTPKSWSPWISLYHRHVEDALEIDQSAGGITLIEEPAPLDPWARAKATTLLRQLDLSLGQDFFWERFRELVTQHAFASASWEEFARPLEENENFLGTLDDWNRGWLETDGVPRLQIQCEEDEQGRVTDCRLLKTRAQENDAFASMSIEVLIESKKERLSRVFVASAFTQERLHELIGHPAPRFALPDSSLRGWATSHFGELQLQEFVPLAPSLMTPMELYAQDLARSRDYEEGLIPVRERLQEIEIAIAHCKDDVSTQALWQRYHAAFRDLPITERNSWGQLAANRWLDRLDDSTATSAMARSWLTGCMRLPLDGSARTRLKRLLAGTWQPKALSISARDRREVLLALAAHGVHDMNSLALDSSGGEGRDWNLLLDAAQPNETKKREAFEEAWRESRSDQWLLDFAKALASGEPEETSWSLTANVLLKAEELLKTHPLEFVAQWIGIILEGPLTQADIATIDQYLWKHSKASRSLRRWVALCRHRIAG